MRRRIGIYECHPATISKNYVAISIRVNKQWRLIFQWDGGRGEATLVYLDGHSYL
jgi:plasmid maintenance system killer protein